MTWQPEWTEGALKDAAQLDRMARERIFQAVERLVKTGYGDIRRVRPSGELALRVGDWRVFFIYVPKEQVIRILRIRPRGSAYKK